MKKAPQLNTLRGFVVLAVWFKRLRSRPSCAVARSNHKLRNHRIEVHCQARKLLAGGGGLIGAGGSLG